MTTQTMMIVHSEWAGQETFSLIPVTENCPYVECIFDARNKVLVVFNKVKKNTYHMVNKLDDSGNPVKLKVAVKDGPEYKQERRAMETFQEYYITNKKDIKKLVEMMAVNAHEFDVDSFVSPIVNALETPKIITP
jgi:hypothetical protein